MIKYLQQWLLVTILSTCLVWFPNLANATQGTITVKDSTGATKTYVVTLNGSGNFLANNVICDATAGANCAAVKAGNTAGTTDVAMVVSDPNVLAAAQAGAAVNGATYPASSIGFGAKDGSGNIQPITGDPCLTGTKHYKNISQTANTQLVALSGSTKIYVCNIFAMGADAENLALVEGTGTVCAASTAGVVGGLSAATGMNFGAGSGWAQGNGFNSIAATATGGDALCLFQSGTGQVAGNISYVQQ